MVTQKQFAKTAEVWLSILSIDFGVVFMHFKLQMDLPSAYQRSKDFKEPTKYLAFHLNFGSTV